MPLREPNACRLFNAADSVPQPRAGLMQATEAPMLLARLIWLLVMLAASLSQED